MKILHIGIASYFTKGMTYQDNLLSEQNVRDGHQVTFISNCGKYEGGRLVDTQPEDKILDNGVRLLRLKYDFIINRFVSEKIRRIRGLYGIIENIKPDVILFHGTCGYALKDVARYKKNNPNIKLYVDSHEDFNNSATNFLSRYILHNVFYKNILRSCLKYIDKILYLSYETKFFLNQLYEIPDEMLEYYPLGGTILNDAEYEAMRSKRRKELQIREEEILIVHSGKLDKLKRTADLLKAFVSVKSDNIKLVIIGQIPEETKDKILKYFEDDSRIQYLGWKNSEELIEYLCACDLYAQPGSQSATMQNALCSRCALMVEPVNSHKHLLGDSVFYVETIEDMKDVFNEIISNPEKIETIRYTGYQIAKEKLDYKKLAERLYK